MDETNEFVHSLKKYKKLAYDKKTLSMKKYIENTKKFIKKKNTSKFVQVNKRNVTTFNSV